MATRNDRLQCAHMYCITSASERKHEIACTSWSLKTLWAGVKHWRTALHRFYVYRKPIDHLHDLTIWKWLKNVYISFDLKCICVWCLDNWSQILSGKPFNTFSMARLKTLQFRLTLAPLFTSTDALFFSLFHHFFFSWSVFGVVRVSSTVIFCYSRDPRFMSLIDSPWFVKFSKMSNFNFQSSIFVVISVNRDLDFFYFSEIRDQKHPPFLN